MKTRLLMIVLLAIGGASARAQIPVSPAKNQLELLKSTDASLTRNKKVVFDFWREVLDGGHMELAKKYLSEDYVQHNPNVPTGLKGFLDVFGKFAKPADPLPTIKRPLISIVAEGDIVVMAFLNSMPVPEDPKRSYTTTAFDMFRVKDGLIVEHWDDFALHQMPPPQP